MLTKQTPDSIRATLTHKAQGVNNTLILTYHNRTPDEYEAFVGNQENLKIPEGVTSDHEGIAHLNAGILLYLIKSFDDGTDKDFPLTRDGLIDLERHWPGTLVGLLKGYHQARAAAVEKN